MPSQRTILVIGSAGFIGRHVCQVLEGRGYRVRPFDRKHGQDITRVGALNVAARGCDGLVNLGGILGTHELNDRSMIAKAIRVNTLGSVNVFEAAKRVGLRVVHASKPNLWLNTYSITKAAAEDFAMLYHQHHGLRVSVARMFNVYGPGQHFGSPQKLAPTAVVNALRGTPIPVFGDGRQTVDHIYVSDAARAIADVLECDRLWGKVVEIGTGVASTVGEFVDRVRTLTRSNSPIEFQPMRSGEAPSRTVVADVRALRHFVGFRPAVSIDDGLSKTIAYFREQLNGSGDTTRGADRITTT